MAAIGDMGAGSPSAKWLLQGDKAATRKLREAIAATSSRVVIVGGEHDRLEALATCDVLLVPQIVESIPLIALEAMASGVPVIAPAVHGISEAVCDGGEGVLFDPDHAERVTAALAHLVQDSARRREMGRHAEVKARRLFDAKRSVAQHARLLAETVLT
jgi:glycosyltransferase involved in cell wall biosynthesis